MCTLTLEIDENAIKAARPDLDSREAIRQWAQDVLDAHVKSESRMSALQRDITVDGLYGVISEEIDSIYANG
ncbi:MAG: hypothetical protein IKW86_05110 [Salinivirgaceae bacterium]|nr:hypothetical protein [Salinivirgaceae bacterium]